MPRSEFSRRQIVLGLAALVGPVAVRAETHRAGRPWSGGLQASAPPATSIGPYDPAVLPPGIRSRFVHNVNGISMHVLEAGYETRDRPAVLLLHGFPELAYSWRKVMPPLAAAGYHVIAPDMRGYGRTDGTDVTYDDDLRPSRRLNHVLDIVALVSAFGYRSVDVVGHDAGSPAAAWCAVVRPDIFRSVVLMSAPFGGTASLTFDTAEAPPGAVPRGPSRGSIQGELAALDPRASTITGTTRRERPTTICGALRKGSIRSCAPITHEERGLGCEQAVQARRLDRYGPGAVAPLLCDGAAQRDGGYRRRRDAIGGGHRSVRMVV